MTRAHLLLLIVLILLLLYLLLGPLGTVPVGPLERLREPLVITIALGYALGRGLVAVLKWLFGRTIALLP